MKNICTLYIDSVNVRNDYECIKMMTDDSIFAVRSFDVIIFWYMIVNKSWNIPKLQQGIIFKYIEIEYWEYIDKVTIFVRYPWNVKYLQQAIDQEWKHRFISQDFLQDLKRFGGYDQRKETRKFGIDRKESATVILTL